MVDLADRGRVVRWALNITANTQWAPSAYEQHLLERYVAGSLTIDEVLHLLKQVEMEQPRPTHC